MDDSLTSTVAIASIFKAPAIAFLIVFHTRVVVTLVQVLKDRRKDFRFFVGKVDSLVGGLEELTATGSLKPWRVGKNVFVGGEQSLFAADSDGDYCTAILISR